MSVTFDRSLARTYLNGIARRRRRIPIRGIVYMHRITDNRMGGTALRNFRMFHAVCGPSAMKNAVIILNMWDKANNTVNERREAELRDTFFQRALVDGACMKRHDGSKSSAEGILKAFVAQSPVDLAIQLEMADKGMALHTTEAGLTLLGDLAVRERKHIDELHRIRAELEEARLRRDVADEGDLKAAEKRLETLRRQLSEEQAKVRRPIVPRPGINAGGQRMPEFFMYFKNLLIAPRPELQENNSQS